VCVRVLARVCDRALTIAAMPLRNSFRSSALRGTASARPATAGGGESANACAIATSTDGSARPMRILPCKRARYYGVLGGTAESIKG
jgi:hypothetical protein